MQDVVELTVDSDRMASFIMAKTVDLPWRGQPNVVCYIPYNQWLEFIQDNASYLNDRAPINYGRALSEVGDRQAKLLFKYYMFDIGWSLYNEVMISANTLRDATLILPYFDDGNAIGIGEVLRNATAMTADEQNKCYSRFVHATPKCLFVPLENLTPWNYNLFLLSIYLQSFAYGRTDKLNVDWRY